MSGVVTQRTAPYWLTGPALLVFLGLAALQAVLAMNMCEDFLRVAEYRTSIVHVLYHAHRGGYGVMGLLNHAQEIRTGTIPQEWKKFKTGLQISLLPHVWPGGADTERQHLHSVCTYERCHVYRFVSA